MRKSELPSRSFPVSPGLISYSAFIMMVIDIYEVRFQNKSRFVGHNRTFYGISRGAYFPFERAFFSLGGLENPLGSTTNGKYSV